MDLSQVPTEDLLALRSGDLSKVSTPTLLALKGDAPVSTTADVVQSAASGLGRGIQYAVDLPAAALATGVEKLTGDTAPARELFKTNMGNGLNAATTAVVGPEYQPQTEAGKLAKGAGMAVATLPLGGAGALEDGALVAGGATLAKAAAKSAGRAALSGAGAEAGGQVGGKVGKAVGGETGETIGSIVGAVAGGGAGAVSPDVASAAANRTVSAAKGASTAVAEGASNIKASFGAKTADQWSQVGHDLSDKALNTLKAADKNGTVIAAPAVKDGLQSLTDEVKGSRDLIGSASNELYPKTKAFLADLSSYQGADMSLEQVHQLRQTGSALISKAFRSGDGADAHLLVDTLDKFDNWVGKLGQDSLKQGSPENIKTFQDFLSQYSSFKRFDKVQKLLEFSHGDINKVRGTIQTWFKPGAEKKIAGFTNEQKAQLRAFAFPGKGEQTLGMIGKFGINTEAPIKSNAVALGYDGLLGALAGVKTGGASLIGGTLAKSAANRIARGKFEKTLSDLAK